MVSEGSDDGAPRNDGRFAARVRIHQRRAHRVLFLRRATGEFRWTSTLSKSGFIRGTSLPHVLLFTQSSQRTGRYPLQQSKVQGQSGGAPLTNFSWNEKMPSLVVTSSIDTTCTVWNLDTSTAVTQLIAHDREVYDVAWLPNSTDIFVSVGADGSLRAFDLRSLEHSTILYETPPPKNQLPTGRPPSSPLLRIAFNPSDPNYMSTFHQDGTDVQILDMRSPGAPVMELRAHRAPINAAGWSSTESGLVATAGGWFGVFLPCSGF